MIVINNINEKYFSLNDTQYPKIYQALKKGNTSLGIYNINDTTQTLIDSIEFTEISIDGNSFNSLDSLISNLNNVLYVRTLSSDVLQKGTYTGTASDLKNDIENIQFEGVKSYQSKSDLEAVNPVPAVGTAAKVVNDSLSENNGYYSIVAGSWVKDSDLVKNDLDPINTSVPISGVAALKLVSPFKNNDPNTASVMVEGIKAVYIEGGDPNETYYVRMIWNNFSGNYLVRLRRSSDNLDSAQFVTTQDLSGKGFATYSLLETNNSGITAKVTIDFEKFPFDTNNLYSVNAFLKAEVNKIEWKNKIEDLSISKLTHKNQKENMIRFYEAIDNGFCRVTLVGTSITEGRGAQSEKKNMWVNQFEQELIKTFPNVKFEFINYGISSRRLQDYVNNSFVAFASAPASARDGFKKDTDNDAWQIPQVVGKTWKKHAEDTEPDLFVIHHGENDAGNTDANFRTWMLNSIDEARNWKKAPSIAIATPMLGSQDDPAYLAANVFIERYARSIRNIAIEKNVGLIDFNRYWRLLRDGQDETSIEYRYLRINEMVFRSGVAAQNVDSNTLENNNTSTETFYGSENEDYLQANLKCDYTPKASSGQILFSVGATNVGSYLNGLAVRVTSSAVQVWEGDGVLKQTNSFSFSPNTTYRFEASITANIIRVWINEVLLTEYKTPSRIGRGNIIIGSRNSLIDNVFIEGGKTRDVVTPKYPNNELLGSALGAWESGDYSQGGNGINHPSRVALMEAFAPAIKDFINKL